MTAREHSNLRQLTLAYYRGEVGRNRYLELRGQYLRAITEGKDPAYINLNDEDETIPKMYDDVPLAGITGKIEENKTLLIPVLAVFLFVVIIAIIMLW